MERTREITEILEAFINRKGTVTYRVLQSGYINQTFLIEIKGHTDKRLILQSINKHIFPDINALMANVVCVCSSIEKSLKIAPKRAYHNLHFYKTLDGKFYLKKNGIYYRLMDYIDHVPTDSNDTTPELAAEAGKTLGRFHQLTGQIDPHKITEIIPNFHRVDLRYQQFLSIDLENNKRYQTTKDFYKEVLKFEYLVDQYKEILDHQELPLRVVHNDPKLSNILFDPTGKGLCMIDLDTVMPGFLNNDYGDAIRSLTNTADENELDLQKVGFNMALFEHFSKAYLKEVKGLISRKEQKYLTFFALLITFEQLIRFYGDYLNDDCYYQTDYPTHNLQRSKVQLKLLQEMAVRFDEMQNYLEHVFAQKNHSPIQPNHQIHS